MIGFGYAGEAGLMNGILALLLGGMGWAMIVVATGTPWSSGLGVDNSKISARTPLERKRSSLVHCRRLDHLPSWLPLQP